MDPVFRSSRTSKNRTNYTAAPLRKRIQLIAIKSAEYLEGYQLCLHFQDGVSRIIDFAPFLKQSTNPLIRQYLDIEKFKQFNITNGDLEWNNYDLCFPLADLYENRICGAASIAHRSDLAQERQKLKFKRISRRRKTARFPSKAIKV